MNNKRYSQISDSEESNSSLSQSVAPMPKASKEKISSSDLSDSSTDSESARPEPISAKNPSISIKETGTFSRLQKFANNQQLTHVKIDDEITDEDYICMFEVPRSFDVSNIQGKEIDSDRKIKIKVNNIKYTIENSEADIKSINLVTKSLKVIHPLAYLKVLDNTKIKTSNEAVKMEKFTSCLPNVKVRHPLFGPNYEDKIVLYEKIVRNEGTSKKKRKKKKQYNESSQESSTEVQLRHSEKKKKTKAKGENAMTNFPLKTEPKSEKHDSSEVEESIFALLESHIVEKSKKRRKNNTKEDSVESSLNTTVFEEKLEPEHVEATTKRFKNRVKQEYEPSSNDLSFSENDKSQHAKSKTKRQKNKIKEEIRSSQEQEPSSNDFNSTENKRKRKNTMKLENIDLGEIESFFRDKVHRENNIKKETVDIEHINGKKKNQENNLVEEPVNSIHSNFIKRRDSINDTIYLDENKRKRRKSIKEENKSLVDTNLALEEGTEDEERKKKKEKRKSGIKKEASDIETNESYGGVSFDKSKERNKHKNNIVNSTVIPDLQLPLFEFDVSRITNQEDSTTVNESVRNEKFRDQSDEDMEPQQKKKKKKKRIKEESFEFCSNRSNGEEFEYSEDDKHHDTAVKKTKNENEEEGYSSPKKRRRNEDDSEDKNTLISSLLSKVKSEINSSTKVKNRERLES